MTTIIVPFPACGLLSMNDRHHWRAQAARVKAWRTMARLCAHAADWNGTPAGPAVVSCVIDVPDRRRRDPHNLYPTIKAAVDGMVDAGMFVDDDATHLTTTEPTFNVTRRGLPRYATFTITPKERT